MPDRRPSACLRHPLRDRIGLSLAMEEASVDALSDAVALLRQRGDAEVPAFEHRIRGLRIGLLRRRALLSARGVDFR